MNHPGFPSRTPYNPTNVRHTQLSSVKLCELYTERIKQVQPHINVMCQDRFDAALEDAKRIDELLAEFRSGKPESEFTEEQLDKLHSPLLGVPISVKESIQVKGMRNSCGLWERRNTFAQEDAVVVRNVQRFGMVPICTTNTPECTLFWADCQNPVTGRSLNPYDLSRITGSSSGGEGGLLASGGSIIGIGSDIAGSLRIPAHYCGIYSHKPSPFLVSPEGNYPALKESRLRMFTIGPMCRYASDLRPLLKCLISDKANTKQDTYFKFQPDNISSIRQEIIGKLDDQVDLSQLKFFYFDFNQASQLKGKQSVQVQKEIMEGQQEVLDHFVSKFNCKVEHINLDKFIKKTIITWQCLLRCGGTIDRDTSFEVNELENLFGIQNITLEFIKLTLGISKHTKESLLTLMLGSAIPNDRSKAYPLCEKFEKHAAEIKNEMESILGDQGVLIMPTLPTVAYKHHVSLMKTPDIRFTALFNVLQCPVSHATVRLDKKHRMPFGLSVAAKPYNDVITLAVAEEIDNAFGGWTQPTLPLGEEEKQTQSTMNKTNLATSSKSAPVKKNSVGPIQKPISTGS